MNMFCVFLLLLLCCSSKKHTIIDSSLTEGSVQIVGYFKGKCCICCVSLTCAWCMSYRVGKRSTGWHGHKYVKSAEKSFRRFMRDLGFT